MRFYIFSTLAVGSLAAMTELHSQPIPTQSVDPFFKPTSKVESVELPSPLPLAPSQGGKDLTWWRSMGTHYLLDPSAYLGTTRSYPTPSKLSYLPDVTAISHEGIEATVGKFSGQKRFYDYRNFLKREDIGHDYASYLKSAAEAHVDLIWNLGQIHGSQKDHVKLIMENDGLFYKDLIYQNVIFTENQADSKGRNSVYWEIGNEINSYKRFGIRELGDIKNNLENAKDYLEFYLAPAVEAIRAASQDLYHDPRAIKILLGNVTYVRDKETGPFLNAILNGVVEGKHAPSLKGKKGYELVDALGLHYTHGTHSLMESYYQRWVATGLVKGIWNTEELGLRGKGDYEIVCVAFRWLDFWARKKWDPDTARLNFWGDRIERRTTNAGLEITTSGENMERHLGQFFRDLPLRALDAGKDFAVRAPSGTESYGLAAQGSDGTKKIAVLVIPSRKIEIGGVELLNTGTRYKIAAYVQPAASEKKAVSLKETDGGNGVQFEGLTLSDNDALLVEFEPATASQP